MICRYGFQNELPRMQCPACGENTAGRGSARMDRARHGGPRPVPRGGGNRRKICEAPGSHAAIATRRLARRGFEHITVKLLYVEPELALR